MTVPSESYFDEWRAQLDLAPKTKDQMQKDVQVLIKRFPTLQDITAQAGAALAGGACGRESSVSSRKRIMSFSRNYWGYPQAKNAVPTDAQPFVPVVSSKSRKKATAGNGWEPLAPPEVIKLWKAAHEREDAQLADLIILGAYTGARIEELCSLKLEHVTPHALKVADAKTAAGVR